MISGIQFPINILKGSQGFALFVAIFVMAIIMLFLGAILFLSRANMKISSNFKQATQALQVADAGVQHAVAVITSGFDFNNELSCSPGPPPCTLVSNSSFPSGSGFSYTVTAYNDPGDISNGGTATNDGNDTVLLASKAEGPNGTTRSVEVYVNRSQDRFNPPSALYVNASSASPALGSYFFDDDDGLIIDGNDTSPNDLLNGADDTAGLKSPLTGVVTTNSSITNTLVNEYQFSYSGILFHDILGVGSEPSIGTKTDPADLLDLDEIAGRFFNHADAVKYLNGLETDSITCPSASPCQLGTSSAPQITYIKDTLVTDVTSLKGNVTGYGVLVLEGRSTIGGNFKFYGLVVQDRSDLSHYISFEDNGWVYGGVLVDSYDEGDGFPKARFRVEDFSRIFYSSEAIEMVNSLCGSCLPQPARASAWIDK